MLYKSDLESAMRKREIGIKYQPIVHPVKNIGAVIVGSEVLIRWYDPEKGYIAAGDVIELAENSGMMASLDSYILSRLYFPDSMPPYYRLWINLRADSLDDTDYWDSLTRCPFPLVLEMNERDDFYPATEKIGFIQKLGYLTAIDDWNLPTLPEVPFDIIKLDRSFLSEKRSLPPCSLGRIVAEGIETIEESKIMDGLGVPYRQGFFYSRPLPHLLCGVIRPSHLPSLS